MLNSDLVSVKNTCVVEYLPVPKLDYFPGTTLDYLPGTKLDYLPGTILDYLPSTKLDYLPVPQVGLLIFGDFRGSGARKLAGLWRRIWCP